MLVDLHSLDQDAVLDADLCVIGGGAAGITLARSFAGRDLRIVLVESGGLEPDDATQQLYRGADVGAWNAPLHRSRLRYLGGSTNHWQGWCAPFAAVDLEQRAWIPNSGWPFPLAELAPFYDRARRLLGLDPLRFDGAGDLVPEAAEQEAAPLPVDPARLRAVSWQIDHPPTRFGGAFRAELDAAANLRVLLWANAVALERARDRAAIEHVELRSLSGRRARVRARRFVLACGGLENPRLLLASRSVEPQGLGNRRGLVGRFFMDHFQVELGPLFADRAAELRSCYASEAGERRLRTARHCSLPPRSSVASGSRTRLRFSVRGGHASSIGRPTIRKRPSTPAVCSMPWRRRSGRRIERPSRRSPGTAT